MAAIGGQHQFIAQALGRVGEGARLVAGGGADQEQAFVHGAGGSRTAGSTQMPAPSNEKIEPTLTVRFEKTPVNEAGMLRREVGARLQSGGRRRHDEIDLIEADIALGGAGE